MTNRIINASLLFQSLRFTFFLLAVNIILAIPQAQAVATAMPDGLGEAVQKSRHKIEVVEEKDRPQSWQAENPGNHLRIEFDGSGIDVISTRDDWRWGMELQRIGAPDKLQVVPKAEVVANGNRLTYERGIIDVVPVTSLETPFPSQTTQPWWGHRKTMMQEAVKHTSNYRDVNKNNKSWN